MKPVSTLFLLLGLAVFIQLLLGGLLTFGFITAGGHIAMGIVVFIVAIATTVVASATKPVSKPLRGTAIGITALIVVQGILGLETLKTGSFTLAWIHFVVAMAIYGGVVSGMVQSMRMDHMVMSPMLNH